MQWDMKFSRYAKPKKVQRFVAFDRQSKGKSRAVEYIIEWCYAYRRTGLKIIKEFLSSVGKKFQKNNNNTKYLQKAMDLQIYLLPLWFKKANGQVLKD